MKSAITLPTDVCLVPIKMKTKSRIIYLKGCFSLNIVNVDDLVYLNLEYKLTDSPTINWNTIYFEYEQR